MHIRIYLTLWMAVLGTYAASAQDNGRKHVEQLCGCFSVNFRYAETFAPDENYKYHDREEMNATELVLPIESTSRKIVMQHLLVIKDTMVIKHWREEWEYESPVLYSFVGNKVWKRQDLPAAEVKNKWTQTVWEVNDEPRYQGISSWITNNGKTYWEHTADAPLPRREYTVRNDYNILRRNNKLVLTNEGYTHEQDNEKVLRAAGTDKLIAQEKGYNEYRRMDDKECAAARAWWKKNEAFWSVVRDRWNSRLSNAQTISVKPAAEDKKLEEYFTNLYLDWSKNKVSQQELPGKVEEILSKFL